MNHSPTIDWLQQWQDHAHQFRNGFAHIPLLNGKETILLQPGPGFGDLSHPTTGLALKLMEKYVRGHSVLDIGSGSGILSLAAAKLGAKQVYGIDIDLESLEHAKENAYLNHLSHVSFFTPEAFTKTAKTPSLILINMIRSEQNVAWASLPQLHSQAFFVIASGVLVDEKDTYLKECLARGWNCLEIVEENNWLGFLFSNT